MEEPSMRTKCEAMTAARSFFLIGRGNFKVEHWNSEVCFKLRPSRRCLLHLPLASCQPCRRELLGAGSIDQLWSGIKDHGQTAPGLAVVDSTMDG